MIYDDQPEMEHAISLEKQRGALGAYNLLEAAFAAIDREALIEKAASVWPRGAMSQEKAREQVETVLVATGIIPEKS